MRRTSSLSLLGHQSLFLVPPPATLERNGHFFSTLPMMAAVDRKLEYEDEVKLAWLTLTEKRAGELLAEKNGLTLYHMVARTERGSLGVYKGWATLACRPEWAGGGLANGNRIESNQLSDQVNLNACNDPADQTIRRP